MWMCAWPSRPGPVAVDPHECVEPATAGGLAGHGSKGFAPRVAGGLVIDGYVKVAGRLPSLDEVKRLILAAKAA